MKQDIQKITEKTSFLPSFFSKPTNQYILNQTFVRNEYEYGVTEDTKVVASHFWPDSDFIFSVTAETIDIRLRFFAIIQL